MIELVLPYPLSANRYWKAITIGGKNMPVRTIMAPTKEADAYKRLCREIATNAGLAQPLDWRFLMDIRLYPALPQDWAKRKRASLYWDDDVRCMDLGNCEKVLADALQGIVYTDDRWVWQQHKYRMEPDHKGARVEVSITPVDRVHEVVPMQQEMAA